jgi:hypothetical protein
MFRFIQNLRCTKYKLQSASFSPTSQLCICLSSVAFRKGSFYGLKESQRKCHPCPALPDTKGYRLISIAFTHDFVMHAVLGWAASHLLKLSSNPQIAQSALSYRSLALQGLQEAIDNFSASNSDAILGASIALSWQATDLLVEWRPLEDISADDCGQIKLGSDDSWHQKRKSNRILLQHCTKWKQGHGFNPPH